VLPRLHSFAGHDELEGISKGTDVLIFGEETEESKKRCSFRIAAFQAEVLKLAPP
jgi:hypothetical protein